MEELDYWQLVDQLNIIQAALLVCGENPSSNQSYVEDWDPENRPSGYEAAKAAISAALMHGAIDGKWVRFVEQVPMRFVDGEDEYSIDLVTSWVEVASLRSWLEKKGFSAEFFDRRVVGAPEYLDPKHPRYAPKLAAAVEAWLALEDASLIERKSVKQALVKWLEMNAAKLSLSDEKGKMNTTGIDEIAKVANWQPSGGAPKTPSG
jgi:hypothetical protein